MNHTLNPDRTIKYPVVGTAIGLAAKIVKDAGYTRSQFLRMMDYAWDVISATETEFTGPRD